MIGKVAHTVACFGILLSIGGCAGKPFLPEPVETAPFVSRAITQTIETITVSAAVPGPEETKALLGIDLYAQGIQPVWLEVRNEDEKLVRAAVYSVDDEYYSPLEIVYTNRKAFDKDSVRAMERWFVEHQMPRFVPPGESRSGLVFTHLTQGTKGFNFDVHSNERSFNFTFFVPLPGFRADFMDVEFVTLYRPEEIRDFDLAGFRAELESHACCSRDASGTQAGDPLNVVLVGSGLAVRRTLLRGGWQETESGSPDTALARRHHYRGRPPDGTFHKSRPDGTERKELRLWLAPMRVDSELVWIGQASYDMSGATGRRTLDEYKIDPDLDDARMFLMQNFWYSQSLAKSGLVHGIARSTLAEPASNFAGDEYFTDGYRAVLFVSEKPVGLDESVLLPWELLDDD